MRGSETVTVQRAGTTTNGYNNVIPAWGELDETTVTGCLVDPGQSYELVDGRNTTVDTPTVYAPPGTDVVATDRLVVREATYEVTGTPARCSMTLKSAGMRAVPPER